MHNLSFLLVVGMNIHTFFQSVHLRLPYALQQCCVCLKVIISYHQTNKLPNIKKSSPNQTKDYL